ncbi:oligopeptide transporter substrate-binding protein [Mycobacterium montefiorense]|uniref:oligopeptide transporter substrate-binding protein n=1 Tax=Mycobacterium montefiorense TaxID=154654 RepID=UPI0021F352A3|nr:oligopeptide transporter substrate-binding protein [Mycobacterium montefiorense]MCV7429054.1 oligopeptide transporter substrate-binding protein [Mycobacterium montefiorense]
MARHAPADYGVDEPTVYIHYGDDVYGPAQPVTDDPIPGWRKPFALTGWGILIAVLIALIVWGIVQLAQGPPPQEPITRTTPVPTTTTTRPSSSASVAPPQSSEPATTTSTPEAPTASTEESTPMTTPTTSSSEAYPLPQLPSVITLPALPGLPTEITLPPGL